MSSKEHKQKIWSFIKDIKVGMLTTYDAPDLRARPMHIVQKDYDGTLWFFTKKTAEKVFETQNEQHICITFCDHDKDIHISLSGKARLTQDKKLIEKFWNPFVSAWFERDKNSREVALLEIDIYQGEHWETKGNTMTRLYEIAKANFTDKKPDLGENIKFG